jgi:hypothetical protein
MMATKAHLAVCFSRTVRPETTMSNFELVVPAARKLNSVTRSDQDQSVLADSDKLRQQRLLDRDKHHHKQLWTKDPHGGQYRKVWQSYCILDVSSKTTCAVTQPGIQVDKYHLETETLSDNYLQVAPARKTEVTLQTIEPGHEKPKSGPTTNFVGKTKACERLHFTFWHHEQDLPHSIASFKCVCALRPS